MTRYPIQHPLPTNTNDLSADVVAKHDHPHNSHLSRASISNASLTNTPRDTRDARAAGAAGDARDDRDASDARDDARDATFPALCAPTLFTEIFPPGAYVFEGCVNYCDADILGIMHHARYFEVAERARADALQQAGVAINDTNNNLRFAIRHIDVRFAQPLHFNARFVVVSMARQLRSVGISFVQLFFPSAALHALALSPHSPHDVSPNVSSISHLPQPATSMAIDLVTLSPTMTLQKPSEEFRQKMRVMTTKGEAALTTLHSRLGGLKLTNLAPSSTSDNSDSADSSNPSR